MTTTMLRGWVALALLACLTSVNAQDAAGVVKTSKGLVMLDRSGQRHALNVGFPVEAGDRISTGPGGYAGITLRDDTLLTMGPNSSFVLDKFQFDPKTDSGNYLVSMFRGVFMVVSGLIARQSPESVEFRTPTATIGIRGTEFIVELAGTD
jgi:hypothetical protein